MRLACGLGRAEIRLPHPRRCPGGPHITESPCPSVSKTRLSSPDPDKRLACCLSIWQLPKNLHSYPFSRHFFAHHASSEIQNSVPKPAKCTRSESPWPTLKEIVKPERHVDRLQGGSLAVSQTLWGFSGPVAVASPWGPGHCRKTKQRMGPCRDQLCRRPAFLRGLSYSNAPPPQPRCWGWGAVTSPNSFLLRRGIWKPTPTPHPALPQPGGSQLRPRARQMPVQASLSAKRNLQECLPRSPCCPAGRPTRQPAAFPPFTVLRPSQLLTIHAVLKAGMLQGPAIPFSNHWAT